MNKYCVNCKHYKEESGGRFHPPYHYCYVFKVTSLVTGKDISFKKDCHVMRLASGECGLTGEFWEAK